MAKRRKILWNRVIGAAVVLVALVFLLGSCVHSCATRSDSSSSVPDSTPAQTLPPPSSDGQSSGGDSSSQADSAEDPATDGAVPTDYETAVKTAGDVYKGNLVLVNAQNPSHLSEEELELVQVYYAEDRPDCYHISYPGHTSCSKTAVSAFNRMMKDYYAKTSNGEIMFNYGYVEAGKEKSNPESPCGLDIQIHLKLDNGTYNYVSNVEPYSWIFSNMANYGFILRYPEGKEEQTGEKGGFTALRYVGVPHAAYITENDLCLEEYLSLLKEQYVFGENMLNYTFAEQNYEIYYVPASSTGDTDVPVPAQGSYEISGNNVDGFIVAAMTGEAAP